MIIVFSFSGRDFFPVLFCIVVFLDNCSFEILCLALVKIFAQIKLYVFLNNSSYILFLLDKFNIELC